MALMIKSSKAWLCLYDAQVGLYSGGNGLIEYIVKF